MRLEGTLALPQRSKLLDSGLALPPFRSETVLARPSYDLLQRILLASLYYLKRGTVPLFGGLLMGDVPQGTTLLTLNKWSIFLYRKI